MSKLQQTVPVTSLIPNGVYRLYYNGVKEKDLAVFTHIGGTGLPVFHPLGESSFQDVFLLKGYGKEWIVIFEREGTPEDIGG